MAGEDFWKNGASSSDLVREVKRLKEFHGALRDIDREIEGLLEIGRLAEEEGEEGLTGQIEREIEDLESRLERLETRLMLGGEDDGKNAILNIHPGAGGLESQDWVEMLLRMYVRYFERIGYSFETLDHQEGEGAGLKNVTLEVKGDMAFGYLKSESGVHRLVRISPFDQAKRRHTSFASVLVTPEIEDDVEVEIEEGDLRVDTYRASGAGGQHVNKTDSAVRITHEPSGIVVQCQSERSQHRNRENAMRVLRSRLYQKKMEEERARVESKTSKKEIAWGSQIRSYVFHPYTLVKDHRTKAETSNVQAVMDGDLDLFVQAYLKQHGEIPTT
jgi:peptide chain release factor 2